MAFLQHSIMGWGGGAYLHSGFLTTAGWFLTALSAHCKQSKTGDGEGLGMRLGKPGNETIDLH